MTTEETFTYKEGSEFDFSKAQVFRKTAALDKSNVEIATTPHEVVTVINGKEETRNQAQPGDRIITGVKGERYVIKEAKFGGLYEEDPADSSRYISKNVIRAMQLGENTELTAPWGEKQRAAKGGYVAQRVDNPSDIYLIEEGAFKATYAPETAAQPNFTARVASSPRGPALG